MTQITPFNNEFRLKVYSLDYPELYDTSNEFLMYPYKIERVTNGERELVYKVRDGGSTLRDFITKLNATKRICFRKDTELNPLKLLADLIVIYDVLLSSNKITNQMFINPDLIWITKDYRIKVIYTSNMDIITNHDFKLYWSPELFSKQTKMYANTENEIQKQITSKRYDSRSSCVYSLGLVFYFMITGDDPFDGNRIRVYDRPNITMMNPIYARLIWNATCSDMKERPSMKEWFDAIYRELNKKKNDCLII